MSPFEKLNIPGIVVKSTNDFNVQSPPKNVKPVNKEHRNLKCASTTKLKASQFERTQKFVKLITVRDDCLIIINIKTALTCPSAYRTKMIGCSGNS